MLKTYFQKNIPTVGWSGTDSIKKPGVQKIGLVDSSISNCGSEGVCYIKLIQYNSIYPV